MQCKRNEKLLITQGRVMNSFGSGQGQSAGCCMSGAVLSEFQKIRGTPWLA